MQNDRIVLEKFPKYWDAANYHFDRLVFTPIPDNTVRLNNLRAGDLDIIERVDAPDDQTVVLNLSEPDASLLSQLSDRAGMMISPASFDKDPGGKPVCSGPYQFKERVQNDRIVLEKFPKYWDAANYHFDRL
ncbi:hypothetical protein CTI14_41035, partial [Methylobacterium radiotolerans]